MMKASDIQVGGSHYKDMVIQPYQFALANQLDYCQANVIKYVCRHASKNGLQDLEKAKHYIDLMIEHYYQNQSSEVPKAILEAEKKLKPKCDCAHWKNSSFFHGETHTCADCGGEVTI